jgi:hypothetical protein
MSHRMSSIVKVLKEYDITVSKPKGGSHWKIADTKGNNYFIALHNGLRSEVSDHYCSLICKAMKLDMNLFKK